VAVHHAAIGIESEARVTFHDVTDDVVARLRESGIAGGIAVVSSPHTTCSVLIQEASHDTTDGGVEYLMQDLVDVLRGVIPDCTAEGQYHHPGPRHIAGAIEERGEEAWWSLNVDAHLRSVLAGRSATIPIVDGALVLGEFGRIYFADFDQTRARRRTVHVTFIGERGVRDGGSS
jgi:secondary thiamine-phosphate synthase enzyme